MQGKNSNTFNNRWFPAVVKKLGRIVLHGQPFNQSIRKKASPYQLPCDIKRYETASAVAGLLFFKLSGFFNVNSRKS